MSQSDNKFCLVLCLGSSVISSLPNLCYSVPLERMAIVLSLPEYDIVSCATCIYLYVNGIFAGFMGIMTYEYNNITSHFCCQCLCDELF